MKMRDSFVINNLLFFSTLLILSFSYGCDQSVKISNSPPSILSLEADACYTTKGGTIHLTASAKDDDGDALFYDWKTTGGSFSGKSSDGTKIDWTAPDQAGEYVITLSVTDQIDVTKKSVSIEACERFPSSMSQDMTIVYNGYDYILTKSSTFIVPMDLTLTLGPGVKIIVDNEFGGFSIYGTLIVNGTQESPVNISPNMCEPEKGLWKGLSFSGSLAHGELDNLLVSYATDGITFEKKAVGTLNGCSIFSNSNRGLVVTEQTTNVSLDNCKVWDNVMTGVYVRDASFEASNSSIRYNGENGLELNVTDQSLIYISVDSCVVANNNASGFLLKSKAAPSIHYCSIFSNGLDTGGYGIELSAYSGTDSLEAEYNFWGLMDNPEVEIPEMIFDKHDDITIGAYVSYAPWLTSPPVSMRAGQKGEVR